MNIKNHPQLISLLGQQTAVFIVVYYAVINNNLYAETILQIYVWFIAIFSLFSLIAITLTLNETTDRLKIKFSGDLYLANKDKLEIIRIIFSIIEITIFISYTLYLYAFLWALIEIILFVLPKN